MRYTWSVLGFALVFGCTTTTAPERVRVLGTIASTNDEPDVTVEPDGRRVDLSISTYGNGCYTQGETDVVINGLEAHVSPHDYTAPAGSNCTDIGRTFVHRASLQFEGTGTAQIRIRGLVAGANDTLVVVRTVQLF